MATGTIIGIAGASGAGKSLLARVLYKRLLERWSERDVTILHEDSYYRSRDDLSFERRKQINYDHPSAFEHSLLVKHLQQLRAGNSVEVPQYNYAQHNRNTKTKTSHPAKVVILEGILILSESQLRAQLDLKVFVDVPLDICLCRRVRRDMLERQRSLKSVIQQYESTVRPMFFEFIEPTKNWADIIVPHGGENLNALDVLHNHLDRFLSTIDL